MDHSMLTAIIGLVALLAGIVAGKFIFAKNTKQKIDEAESQARKIVADAQTSAETIKQQKQLEAKEKFLATAADHYIQSKNLDVEVRYDIVSIVFFNGKHELKMIEDAFYPYM